jgi:hypothetical protein
MRNINKDSRRVTPASHSCSNLPTGKFKCNVETACYTDDNSLCVGACIRDEHGQFLQAYTRRFQGMPPIAEAEAT